MRKIIFNLALGDHFYNFIFWFTDKIQYFQHLYFTYLIFLILFMTQNLAIGVDIGGSHISCAAVDLKSFKILNETRTEKAVDNKAEANQIIRVWVQALTDVIKKIPWNSLKGIGFGMPGPFDYVKGISYIKGVAKYENLYGMQCENCNIRQPGFSGRFPGKVYE